MTSGFGGLDYQSCWYTAEMYVTSVRSQTEIKTEQEALLWQRDRATRCQ